MGENCLSNCFVFVSSDNKTVDYNSKHSKTKKNNTHPYIYTYAPLESIISLTLIELRNILWLMPAISVCVYIRVTLTDQGPYSRDPGL